MQRLQIEWDWAEKRNLGLQNDLLLRSPFSAIREIFELSLLDEIKEDLALIRMRVFEICFFHTNDRKRTSYLRFLGI